MLASRAPRIRRALALVLALCAALAAAGPLAAQEKDSLWTRLRGHGRQKPAAQGEAQGPLVTLQRKLTEAKAQRQQLARLGADSADLHRMDARIAGIEELADLIIRRQEMVRAAQPREQIAQLDRRILEVRENLRRTPLVLPAQGPTGTAGYNPLKNDPWSGKRGNRAASAYEEGALRRSMGI